MVLSHFKLVLIGFAPVDFVSGDFSTTAAFFCLIQDTDSRQNNVPYNYLQLHMLLQPCSY